MVGEDGLDGDAVSFVEGDGLVECVEDAGSFFVREERGKSQATVVIDGDMERLRAGTRIAMGPIAGGANARLEKAAKLFNIKMKEFTGRGAFITDDWRFWRLKRSQPIETVTFEDAGKGSFRDGQDHEDLGVGTALAAEGEDLGFQSRRSFARLTQGH